MRNHHSLTFLYTAAAFFFVTAAYAQQPDRFWVSIGGYTLRPNNLSTNSVTVSTKPQMVDYYFPNGINQITSFNVSVFYQLNQIAYKDLFCYPLSYRVGLTYLWDINFKTTGKIRTSGSDKVDYRYRYNDLTRALFLDLQVDFFPHQWLGPYIDLGAGVARSLVNGYGESPLKKLPPRISPAFASHLGYPLVFRAGIGVNYQFSIIETPMVVSFAYMYQNLGSARTGNQSFYPRRNQYLSQRIAGGGFEFALRAHFE